MAAGFMPLAAPAGGFALARLWSGRMWSALAAAALVIFVIVPVANLVVPEGSVFHVSEYTVTLAGKIMCYAIVALAMDLIWGYTGILSLGHGFVLRARRLRDGHVPDALHRPRRRLQEPAAGLHGVPRLEGLSLVLEIHPTLLVLRASGRAGARTARAGLRILRVSLAHQGRLFLHPQPGADLRRRADVLPQRHLRRQQRFHGFQAHPRPDSTRVDEALRSTSLPACCAAAVPAAAAGSHAKFGRVQRAIRDTENRVLFSGYTANFKLFVLSLSR